MASLACSYGSSILQAFPFGDLMIGGVAVIDPHNQVSILLRRLRWLIMRLLHICVSSVLDLRLINNQWLLQWFLTRLVDTVKLL